MLFPVMPVKCNELRAQLGMTPLLPTEQVDLWPNPWGGLRPGTQTQAATPLFPRFDETQERSILERLGIEEGSAQKKKKKASSTADRASGEGEQKDPYDNAFYRGYKAFLAACIKFRWVTVAVVLALFAVSLYAFQFTDKSFFPASTTPKFRVDVFWPIDQHIDETEKKASIIEKGLAELEGERKLLEAQRLEQRTRYDLEMIREIGYWRGVHVSAWTLRCSATRRWRLADC